MRCDVKAILALYNEKKERIQKVARSHYIIKILDTLFTAPIFSATGFIKRSGIPKRTAFNILKLIEKEKIISLLQPAKGQKAGIYIFNKLMKIIK